MPLLDHFHPPLSRERHWESFHAAWIGSLADDLNRRLPPGYFAEEQVHADAARLPPETLLYAVAYRPIRREQREEIDLWPNALALGAPLPTLPLALNAEIGLLIDLEATYLDACRRRRIA